MDLEYGGVREYVRTDLDVTSAPSLNGMGKWHYFCRPSATSLTRELWENGRQPFIACYKYPLSVRVVGKILVHTLLE